MIFIETSKLNNSVDKNAGQVILTSNILGFLSFLNAAKIKANNFLFSFFEDLLQHETTL